MIGLSIGRHAKRATSTPLTRAAGRIFYREGAKRASERDDHQRQDTVAEGVRIGRWHPPYLPTWLYHAKVR